MKVKDSELSELLEGLTIECDITILDKVGDFSLSEEKIHLFTGLTWENIIELREMLTSVRNSQTPRCNRSPRRVLIKIEIRKLQQNDCCNFAIRTRATCFRLCRFYHELF